MKIAETDNFDAYQHFVLMGQKYFSCNYLEIVKEHKTFVQYKKLTSMVFVHPRLILSPFVNITDDFKLSLDDKQWLCDM